MILPKKIIDLTHTLSPSIPSWNGSCGFELAMKLDYKDCKTPVKFRVQQLKMHGGIGTHMDAPLHCFENRMGISEIPIKNLMGPGIRIDVSAKCHERFVFSLQDLNEFEDAHGKIPPESIVFIRSGWDRFWGDPEKYRNQHIFPCVDEAVAEYLVARGVKGIGVDTLSPDRPERGFPVHKAFLGSNKWILENVAHLDELPPTGSMIFALPMKAENATEAPVRLIALIETVA